ncbi:MAG: group II intron reverse transcriptase/maturase, partial [Clostridiaceae bacterium]|nr:group II intron reverse transcriptase/maturase [Clostridiaceae bacterium]
KAAGIDRVTKDEYGKNLDENLVSLIGRMKKFSYKPLPVRRTYIAKQGSNKMRALGISAYEDKLVQGVMSDALTMVCEHKFMDTSYGFRPNRDCHKAIRALDDIIIMKKTSFIVDADIRGFFDNVNHEWLIKFLEHDIEDRNFIRYIKRFLRSGIMEEGKFLDSDMGTPQGGLISPILANVYLHYVLDLWFEKKISREFYGEAHMVRCADDFVCCFQYEEEARKFFGMLKERFVKFGLELSEEKSKIIRFGRYAREHGSKETFDFLGFTHINGISRNGKYIVLHYTAQKKMVAKMQVVKAWLQQNKHMEKCELVRRLNQKLVGHYRYFGVTGNMRKMRLFAYHVTKMLYKALNSRSQKRMNWDTFNRFLEYNPVAAPKIYYSLWSNAK